GRWAPNTREDIPMSEPPLPDGPSGAGDDNVARLVGEAYRPEPVDPDFTARTHARLAGVAAERRRRAAPPRLSLGLLAGVAAVLALAVLPALLWRRAAREAGRSARARPV